MKKLLNNSGSKRRRAGLAAVGIVALGGAIGGGLTLFDQPFDQANASNSLGSGGKAALTLAGHVAEPFVPCSTNIAECFRKAKVTSSVRLGPAIRRGASRSTGPRSRLIPARDDGIGGLFDESLPLIPSFPGQFAFGGVPTGGFAGAPFGPFPGALVPGGIGGETPATPAPSPSPTNPGEPTPTPTPTGPETPGPDLPDTPVPAVPEPATWLQMLLGFAIVGSVLRRMTGRRITRRREKPVLS